MKRSEELKSERGELEAKAKQLSSAIMVSAHVVWGAVFAAFDVALLC